MEALVLVGHGSHVDPHSSVSVFEHADRIRAKGLFAEVKESFWKEEPAIAETVRTLRSDKAIIVPVFMSEGYFTTRVIPRELGLHGAQESIEREIIYTDPVGTHDTMTEVIVDRAKCVVGDRDPREFALAVVGHGTPRHSRSSDSTYYHVDRLRNNDIFASVSAFFLDEKPNIESLDERLETRPTIVVPLFVADGKHTRNDIPKALGLSDSYRFGERSVVDGREIWFTNAVGTDDSVVDVILGRVRDAIGKSRYDDLSEPDPLPTLDEEAAIHAAINSDEPISIDGFELSRLEPNSFTVTFDEDHYRNISEKTIRGLLDDHYRFVSNWFFWSRLNSYLSKPEYSFVRWLEHADRRSLIQRLEPEDEIFRTWGELQISTSVLPNGSRSYCLKNKMDANRDDTVDRYRDPSVAAQLARYDDDHRFRPLKSAPTLPTGWAIVDLDPSAIIHAVDSFYPASIANWHLECEGDLDVNHWVETADRQTGIYRCVGDLEEAAVIDVTASWCTDDQCLKRRRWNVSKDSPIGIDPGQGEFPCREPCSVLLEAARKSSQEEELN